MGQSNFFFDLGLVILIVLALNAFDEIFFMFLKLFNHTLQKLPFFFAFPFLRTEKGLGLLQ